MGLDYRLVFDKAIDPIFVTHNDTITMANPATERLIGYSAKELRRMPWLDLICPEDKELVMETRKRRLSGEDPYSIFSHRAVTRAGNTVWVEIHSVQIDWNDMPATLVFARDITARKRIEEDEQEHLRQLHQALAEARMLRGILPTCSRCKKIRRSGHDETVSSSWVPIETYLAEHSEALFSHGLCPDCYREMYGDDQWRRYLIEIRGKKG